MRLSLFGPFEDTIEAMPVCAIITTLDRVSRMWQDDLVYDRPMPVREIESLLSFCDFVKAVKEQSPVPLSATTFPLHHLGLYKKIIERLVGGGELPAGTLTQFESAFFKVRTEQLPGGTARQTLWPDF